MNGQQSQTILNVTIVLVGLGLLVAGVIATFASSNSSASAVLVGVGAASLLIIVFRDRIQEARFGGVEIKLAVQVKDQLRAAFDLKMSGNYEGSEWELRRAFNQFVSDLDIERFMRYDISQKYESEVYANLEQIVTVAFEGKVLNSSARGSFYPLVDAVLELKGPRVLEELEKQHLELCQDLVRHLDQELRVGVTIRPGPDLEPDMLVRRLQANVQDGALNATCFLLIQNCREKESGEKFRELAREQGMHATYVVWPAHGTVKELGDAITDAIVKICSEQLPTA